MSKYELSISTGYVKDWGIVEAMRELYQNALDNEINNPENIMSSVYDKEQQEIRISNKTSFLEKDSLLLGSSTKSDDKNTIGQHGEGYKIAFMVLLRNGKSVTVYNYGKKEVWKASLVKSRRYNNQEIPLISVEKHVWSRVPDSNLTIVVGGITEDEYELIRLKNLNLRENVNSLDIAGMGRILRDESEAGNIYVKGLFIAKKPDFKFGYDFEPHQITLDRDRRILDSIRVAFETAELWNHVIEKYPEYQDEFLSMFKEDYLDVKYAAQTYISKGSYAAEVIASGFVGDYGEDAIPVINNNEYDDVKSNGGNPIIVSSIIAEAVRRSSYIEKVSAFPVATVRERLEKFKNKIASKLDENELNEFSILISRVEN